MSAVWVVERAGDCYEWPSVIGVAASVPAAKHVAETAMHPAAWPKRAWRHPHPWRWELRRSRHRTAGVLYTIMHFEVRS